MARRSKDVDAGLPEGVYAYEQGGRRLYRAAWRTADGAQQTKRGFASPKDAARHRPRGWWPPTAASSSRRAARRSRSTAARRRRGGYATTARRGGHLGGLRAPRPPAHRAQAGRPACSGVAGRQTPGQARAGGRPRRPRGLAGLGPVEEDRQQLPARPRPDPRPSGSRRQDRAQPRHSPGPRAPHAPARPRGDGLPRAPRDCPLPQACSAFYRPLAETLILTAMRVSEACGLEVGDVDPPTRWSSSTARARRPASGPCRPRR
jgi:hypothetical protein